MSGVLGLGLFLGIIVVLDVLVARFGADTRYDFSEHIGGFLN